MRRKIKSKVKIKPDSKYNSELVSKFINRVMLSGKKNTATKVVYEALNIVKEKEKIDDPLKFLEETINNVGPLTEVRSRRIGGATYQVPREVRQKRRVTLAMKWIIDAARGKKGMPMASKLSEELILASKNEGEAFKKKENTHKMAEANRAFAHFAW